MLQELKSFILNLDPNDYDILLALSNEDLGRTLNAILAYSKGIKIELPENLVFIFEYFKKQIDSQIDVELIS